jgi:hypothetical protein
LGFPIKCVVKLGVCNQNFRKFWVSNRKFGKFEVSTNNFECPVYILGIFCFPTESLWFPLKTLGKNGVSMENFGFPREILGFSITTLGKLGFQKKIWEI